MARVAPGSSIRPGEVNAEVAARALRRVKDYLSAHPATPDEVDIRVEAGGDEALVVPRPVVAMFAHILAETAQGRGVFVMPSHAELTTQQAADMLNVSRPYLIGLLEAGEIPYRKVGRHRRVKYEDLVTYMRRDDQHRRDVADELADLSQELDLY